MANSKLQYLTEVFNKKIFRIPDFQRGYSWQEAQLEDFWEDLINLKENKIHYTGLLTIEPIPESKIQKDDSWFLKAGYKAYYLIDGQQRLTTAIILINEILNKFENDAIVNCRKKSVWEEKFLFLSNRDDYKSYIFGYEHDNPSDEYFRTGILGQYSSSSDKTETLYTDNLKKAKEFFKKKLGGKKQGIEKNFKKLITGFGFNLYEIDNELDVYVTFETMNNRGKPLSNLELLKNRLIYLSTLLEVEDKTKEGLRKDINEIWKTIYEYLGKNKEKPMDDDAFLKNHWIMYFKYDRSESASYAKFLLNKNFTSNNVIKKKIDCKNIQDYIHSLSTCIRPWFYLFNPEVSDAPYKFEANEWIQKLNRLGMSAFPPLFMAAMTKCDQQDLSPLFESAERFIFLVFKLSQRRSNTENSYFYRLASSFYYGEETVDSVIKKISDKTYYEKGDWYGWFDLVRFDNYIKEQYSKKEGFYAWNGLKYFLYEYELDLQKKAGGDRKISWIEFDKRKKEETIEHIYPQTATEECWTSVFNEYPEKERNILLHSLGNLVLLSRSKNSSLQNKCFALKKGDTEKGNTVGFYNGSYSEIEVSRYEKWTKEEIQDRGKKMLDFLDKRWNVKIRSWEEDKWDIEEGAFKENLLNNQPQEKNKDHG